MPGDEATLVRAGDRAVLRFDRHLRQPVETVWRAVTDPAEMRSWFPTRIEIGEWAVGAALTRHFDGHDTDPMPGVVVEWAPPHWVRFTCDDDTIGFELAGALRPVRGALRADPRPPGRAADRPR